MAIAVAVAVAVAPAACGHRADRNRTADGRRDAAAAVGAPGPGSDAAVAAGLPTLPPAPPLPEVPAGLPPRPARVGAELVTPEAVALGAMLFAERRWSASGTTSCATCHDPAHGYAGGSTSLAADGKPNLRRAPALVNLAWATEYGWDGRYAALGEWLAAHVQGQLGRPGGDVSALASDPVYRAHFARVAPRGEPTTAVALAALAAFVDTRYAGDSPWDRGERDPAVDPQQKLGYQLFNDKAQCSVCHTPPLYTDLRYHAIGLVRVPDEGRGRVDPGARGAFKTPTLREAVPRPAFFHDGSAPTLDAAIDFHLAGGTGQGAAAGAIDPALAAVALTAEERAALGAFVRALSAQASSAP